MLLDQEAFRDANLGAHSNPVAGHLPAVIDKPCRCSVQHSLVVSAGPFELHRGLNSYCIVLHMFPYIQTKESSVSWNIIVVIIVPYSNLAVLLDNDHFITL